MTPEQLAQLFHETYERLAPSFSYETRKASAKPWADVPEKNKALMVATCREVLEALAGAEARAERLAVLLARALSEPDMDIVTFWPEVTGALALTPTEALKQRDAEVRVKALEDAASVADARKGYGHGTRKNGPFEVNECAREIAEAVRALARR